MDLKKANIHNLTNLWKTGGLLAGQYVEEPCYRLSIGESGAWPNKLWFTHQPNMQAMQHIQLKWNLNEISIPIWGEDMSKHELMLKARGFEEKLTQVAMSLTLEEVHDHANKLVIEKVKNGKLAKTWSRLFQEAFGYEISAMTVTDTMESIEYFIGKYDGVPIGTAVLFIDQYGTTGIHSMGIIPSQRRKGYAEELLIRMLNRAQLNGAKHVTLQASEMGKGLYLKTGFQEDFIIKTFTNHKK